MPSIIHKTPGLLTRGTVQSSTRTNLVKVSLDTSGIVVDALYYPAYFGNDGHFIGGKVQPGTPVLVQQGEGGAYYIVAIIANPNKMPSISGNALVIQSDEDNAVILDPDNFITIGNRLKQFRIDAARDLVSSNFGSNYSFSEASINIDGVVRRDIFPTDYDNLNRREGHRFEDRLREICLDPSSLPSRVTSGSTVRNPQFVEKREIVYEFAHGSRFQHDLKEVQYAQKGGGPVDPTFYNRREARTDTLSLSSFAPNYLMETVKGTVIDIYGNVLDLNRNILPVGKEKELSFITNDDREQAFLRLREAERKSIAYHFEINSRKGNPPDAKGEQPKKATVVPLPDIDSNDSWARERSRFFFDVDKEGQFKLNVPASSEKGNIPLLVRTENSSTIEAVKSNTDPNLYSFDGQTSDNRDQRRDVYLDTVAFNGGTITINDSDHETGFATPIDRLSKQTIKHGTMYHDITEVLSAHRTPVLYEFEPVNTLISQLKPPANYVSKEIRVSGPKANAGGRSGSINFDGSIELNVGANTVDKQSMWIDTQGSIVGHVGRDFNNVSMGLSMTGDLLIEVGGSDYGTSPEGPLSSNITDKRFIGKNFAHRAGAVDIRVHQSNGEFTVVRIDESGATILTPTNVAVVAGGDLLLKAGRRLAMDAEEIIMYSNDEGGKRVVMRNGLSIH